MIGAGHYHHLQYSTFTGDVNGTFCAVAALQQFSHPPEVRAHDTLSMPPAIARGSRNGQCPTNNFPGQSFCSSRDSCYTPERTVVALMTRGRAIRQAMAQAFEEGTGGPLQSYRC